MLGGDDKLLFTTFGGRLFDGGDYSSAGIYSRIYNILYIVYVYMYLQNRLKKLQDPKLIFGCTSVFFS